MASPDHDASKDSSKNQTSAAGQEAGPPEEESTPVGEQLAQKKRGKKRRREEKEGKEGKKKAALTASPVERPSRERKSVVRYAATATRRMSATKAVKIQQGPGERLKDIPNVTFKLSKRKSDETLRVLHKILFGRKTNVHFLKRNVLQFSGFVWSQNEVLLEKDRSKIKEKLNKCNKDRLLDFCDLLDVYTLKTTTKKEEISAKLLEFLESPHATRELILSEKDTKGKKRRRVAKGTDGRPLEEASSNKENERPEKADKREAKKGRKTPTKAYKEDLDKGGSIDTNDESADKKNDTEETSEHSNSEAEDEENEYEVPESTKTVSDGEEKDEREEPKSKEKSPAVRKVSRTKSKKGPSASATKKVSSEGEAEVPSESKTSKGNMVSSKTEKKKATVKKDSKDNSTRKGPQKKREAGSDPGLPIRSKKDENKGKNNVGTALRDMKENKKQSAKTASKDMKVNKKQIAKTGSQNAGKKKGKHEDAFVGPSTEQLYAVLSEILKEVDFNVATLADIIRQLGAHFDTDLMHRKTEIKGILEEVINNMTDEEDAEDDDVDGGAKEGGEKK